MENFSEEFLRTICESKVVGDFPPFNTGDIGEVEKYIKKILVKVKAENDVLIKADFDDYGSGFASYVDVRISKIDKSDTKITFDGSKKVEWTKGLSLYISKLCPYWFLAGSEWTASFENDKWFAGSSNFLRPKSDDFSNNDLWKLEIDKIKRQFKNFDYNLLTKKQIEKHLWFDIEIRTILADKPFQVFDCFFYWED